MPDGRHRPCFSLGYTHRLALFGPVALMGLGKRHDASDANAGVSGVRPHLAGSASGLGGGAADRRRPRAWQRSRRTPDARRAAPIRFCG